MSLFYGQCGGLDYKIFLKNTNLLRIHREARELPVEKYDVVINDFEHITALACKKKKVRSVQFGHQASFQSDNTPRPLKKNMLGEMILREYARATHYIGLHFQQYDDFILPPVVKDVFLNSAPTDEGHVTVYLPSFQKHCLVKYLNSLPTVQFHLFLPCVKTPYRLGNITYKPVDNHIFNKSLLSCHGIITGGGFETPAEALYLGKRLMSIPIRGQYEQLCNAAALHKMGVTVLQDVYQDFPLQIEKWLNQPTQIIQQKANKVSDTLQFLFDTYPPANNAFDLYSYDQPDSSYA